MSFYEDFLCPVCGNFEQTFGPTISKLIDSGAIAADYYMVAILDRPTNQNYSSRAGAAALLRGRRDHPTSASAASTPRCTPSSPAETGTHVPRQRQLIEIARQAGVVGKVPECVNSGKYLDMVDGLAAATQRQRARRPSGSTARTTRVDARRLVAKIKGIVGDVPGIDTAGARRARPAPRQRRRP